jgi:sporulation protein YlmC with PRC-barrel domain
METCTICYEELNNDIIVYNWINNEKSRSNFCLDCVTYMLNNNFDNYLTEINKADCEKSLKCALSKPIPLNLTLDSLKNSKEIDFIEYSNVKIPAKLIKKISDDQLKLLNEELNNIFLNLSDINFDYISKIKEIMLIYNLDLFD